MFTFSLESTHFIFNKCPIYNHDSASAKFRTNSHETDYSVAKENGGRLNDHFKVTLNGSQLLNVSFSAADIFTVSKHPRLEAPVEPAWHRDILLRRNMGSSTWSDLYAGILCNKITVFDKNGPVPKEKVEDFFKQGKDKLVLHAAGRRAASIDEDQRSMVGLHSLPAPTSQLDGNPVFKEKPVQTLRLASN
jgi:hypothetical protein